MRSSPPAGFDAHSFLEGTYWHQGWDIFPGIRIPGPSGVEHIMERVCFPSNIAGKRVLDVGAWNGCSSFECERRGAREVIALSLEDPTTSGFNKLKAVLESERTQYLRGTIYNLDPRDLGKFDIVLCFGVVYHLRYPALGIDNLRRVASGDLYLESLILDDCLLCSGRQHRLADIDRRLEQASLMQFYQGDEMADDASNWVSPSASALVGLLESAGFDAQCLGKDVSRGYFRGRIKPGFPGFLTGTNGKGTCEGQFYDECGLSRLFGPKDLWRI